MLVIINAGIEKKLDNTLSEIQYGFVVKKKEPEIRLHYLKLWYKWPLNANRDIIVSFINYQEAFDELNHELLIKILKKI